MKKMLKPCIVAGCPNVTTGTRCKEHARSGDALIKARTKDRRKVYDSRRWAGLRRTVLKQSRWCAVPGCNNIATDIDHIRALRDGGAPYDVTNLQAMCHRHHAEKTAREVWGRKAMGW